MDTTNAPRVDIKRVAELWDSCGSEVSFLDVYGSQLLDETIFTSSLPGQIANSRSNIIWDFAIAKQNPLIKELTEHAEAYTSAAFTPDSTTGSKLTEADVDTTEEWKMYLDPTLRVAFALITLDFGPTCAKTIWDADGYNS
jgi:hypothetical protein